MMSMNDYQDNGRLQCKIFLNHVNFWHHNTCRAKEMWEEIFPVLEWWDPYQTGPHYEGVRRSPKGTTDHEVGQACA